MTFRVGDDGFSIEGLWANDERRFALAIGQLLALEEKRGPIGQIYKRLSSLDFSLDDIRDTIRLGLIGAGTDHVFARKMVEEHVKPGTLALNAMLAQSIVGAALAGRSDLGKTETAERNDATDSPPSKFTEAAP